MNSLALNKRFISKLYPNVNGGRIEPNDFTFHTSRESEYICNGPSVGETCNTCHGTCICQMTQEANCPSDSDSMVCQ